MYGQKDEELIRDLKEEKDAAISHLLKQIRLQGNRILSVSNLSKEGIESILHDAVLLAIQKIKNNQYRTEQGNIVSYTVGIMKYMVLNETRNQNKIHYALDDADLAQYAEPVQEYRIQTERIFLLNQLVEQLSSPCKELIYYRYLEPCPDQEIIDKKIIALSNINSIRVTRNDCLKKLTALASKYKHLFHEI
ncbi:MAG: hypothetical protein IPP06_06195 [Saprospiraceae bacterium]|nr:hypothetical protein [Candidatus Vicinibacter affinis]